MNRNEGDGLRKQPIGKVAVTVLVNPAERVVPEVTVKVQGLWVGGVSVGDRLGNGRPVGRRELALGGGKVPCPEVIEPGFSIAFFAGKLLRLNIWNTRVRSRRIAT